MQLGGKTVFLKRETGFGGGPSFALVRDSLLQFLDELECKND